MRRAPQSPARPLQISSFVFSLHFTSAQRPRQPDFLPLTATFAPFSGGLSQPRGPWYAIYRNCGYGRCFFMRIATWNVNSIRQRLEHLLSWLKDCQPDIVCLQEIKCLDEAFPREPIEALGYNVVTHGQKAFNGVALLSKLPFDETKSGLAGDDEDSHARFLEGLVTLKRGVLRVACLYLPNGNPPETDKYLYKLKWMARLQGYARERL